MTLGVKDAVQVAINYFRSLQAQIAPEIQDIRLEEVEISEDEQFWLITLSFIQPSDVSQNPLPGIITKPQYERNYKLFRINAETGKVEAMKIRVV
jgi:hypothetical protein